jgi:hypothetical protein
VNEGGNENTSSIEEENFFTYRETCFFQILKKISTTDTTTELISILTSKFVCKEMITAVSTLKI